MNYRIVLASASPRRKEILSKLGVQFEVIPSDCEEVYSATEPAQIVKELAILKAEDVYKKLINERTASDNNGSLVVIGSDTIVAHKGRVMGKPHSKEEAFEMIKSYAGDTHQVHTGVCIMIENGQTHSFTVSSSVNVVPMTDEEIWAYVESGEPMDKAGAYALQGLFAPFVSGIEGDYYNIVGFPICRVYHILKDEGII